MSERFAGNQPRSGGAELVEIMPTATSRTRAHFAAIGPLTVANTAIHLQNTLETLKVGDRPLGSAVGRVDVANVAASSHGNAVLRRMAPGPRCFRCAERRRINPLLLPIACLMLVDRGAIGRLVQCMFGGGCVGFVFHRTEP